MEKRAFAMPEKWIDFLRDLKIGQIKQPASVLVHAHFAHSAYSNGFRYEYGNYVVDTTGRYVVPKDTISFHVALPRDARVRQTLGGELMKYDAVKPPLTPPQFVTLNIWDKPKSIERFCESFFPPLIGQGYVLNHAENNGLHIFEAGSKVVDEQEGLFIRQKTIDVSYVPGSDLANTVRRLEKKYRVSA